MTLTREQKKSLKVHAYKLKPLIQIGKKGLGDAQILTIKRNLVVHELVKIKFNDHIEKKEDLSIEIIQKTGSNLVDIVGNTLVIYRQSDVPDKRKYFVNARKIQ